MAHGLGAQRDMGVGRYAEIFVNNGYAVFLFDYRRATWGAPRRQQGLPLCLRCQLIRAGHSTACIKSRLCS
jgi:hypothetical protein